MEKEITKRELLTLIENLKGGTFVGLTTLTNFDIVGLGKVQKYCIQSCQIGVSYENCVNNKLHENNQEDDFVTDHLRWGKWFVKHKIITHNNKFYLRIRKLRNHTEQVCYFINGRVATQQESEYIERVKDVDRYSQKQANYGLQKNKQVEVRAYKFDSILSLTINHETYNVVQQFATR